MSQTLGKSLCGREENMACSKQTLLSLGKVIKILPVPSLRTFDKQLVLHRLRGQDCQQPYNQQLARAGSLPGCFLLSMCTTRCHGLFPKMTDNQHPIP